MLLSGKRAAYSGLFHEALKVAVSPLDLVLGWMNRRKTFDHAPSQPLVFVIGPPRGGTTLVYQTLARYCDVSYADNLNAMFPRSPFTALKWSRKTPLKNASLRSVYGQTAGLSGPNEAFHIWNRWLGDDRYQAGDNLSESDVADMTDFFGRWTALRPKPFVNKNNRCTVCMKLLAEKLPTSFFVMITRDERDIVRSLIRGREFVQGSKQTPWGLLSQDNHVASDPLGYVNDVCEQVKKISADMREQAASVDPQRLAEFAYSQFCEDPVSTLEEIALRVPGLELRTDLIARELKPFRVSTGQLLSEEEEARMDLLLQDPSNESAHADAGERTAVPAN